MKEEKNIAFEPVFEDKLVQTMLVDHDFSEQIFEVIDPIYFEQDYTKAFAKILRDYYFDYETFPSSELLPSIVEKNISNSLTVKRCNNFLEKIKKKPLNGDIEYVKDRSLEFFRMRSILETLESEVFPRITEGTGKLEEIIPIIEKSISKGTDRDIGYEYHDDEEDRFNEEIVKTVPSPWTAINKFLKGDGFGEKRVVTFIAPPGAGKSSLLVNCGKSALLQGLTVVHYTFELDKYEVASKYDASITGFEIETLSANKSGVLLSLRAKLPEDAKLFIKEYPVRGASVQTIKSHLSKLKLRGIVPDLIIIDQGGNLKSIRKNNEERFNLSDNWLDMKNLAQLMKVPVLTAHQVNRTGYNDDIILPDQIAGCFDILGTTDIMITMARSVSQKKNGLGKIYFAKNRQGKDGIILGYAINGNTAQIDIFEMTDEMEEIFEEEKLKAEHGENITIAGKLNKFIEKRKEEKL